jgi:hypothetical protein
MSEAERRTKAWRTVRALSSEASQIGDVSNVVVQLIGGSREHSQRLDKLEADVLKIKKKLGLS